MHARFLTILVWGTGRQSRWKWFGFTHGLVAPHQFFQDFIDQGAEIAKRPTDCSKSNKHMFPDFIKK